MKMVKSKLNRFVYALLIIIVINAGNANAEQWSNGLSPSKPYEKLPAVDLTKTIGYTEYYPYNGAIVPKGITGLSIISPRTDLAIGQLSTAALCETESGLVVEFWRTSDINKSVFLLPLPYWHKDMRGWEDGTLIYFKLSKELTTPGNYSMILNGRYLTVPEYGFGNSAYDMDSWKFTVLTQGITKIEKLFIDDFPKVGEYEIIYYDLGEEVSKIEYEILTDNVTIDENNEENYLKAQFIKSGIAEFIVIFYQGDEELYRIMFTTPVDECDSGDDNE